MRLTVEVEDERGLPAYGSQPIDVRTLDVPEKLPPWARILVTMDAGDVPVTVGFAAEAQDPDGVIVDYRWTFHDGTTASGPFVTKDFDEAGSYDVRLEVEDNDGLLGYDEHTAYVVVAHKLPPRIISLPSTQAEVGEPYQYDLDNRAAAQGTRPISWNVGWSDDDTTVGSLTGLGIDTSTGVVTWTPTADQVGRQIIILTAENELGVDVQRFAVTVSAPEPAPPPKAAPRRSGCFCASSSRRSGAEAWLLLLLLAAWTGTRRRRCRMQ